MKASNRSSLAVACVCVLHSAALVAAPPAMAFHSVVLRDGALPMDVLEMKVDRWINQTRGG